MDTLDTCDLRVRLLDKAGQVVYDASPSDDMKEAAFSQSQGKYSRITSPPVRTQSGPTTLTITGMCDKSAFLVDDVAVYASSKERLFTSPWSVDTHEAQSPDR